MESEEIETRSRLLLREFCYPVSFSVKGKILKEYRICPWKHILYEFIELGDVNL